MKLHSPAFEKVLKRDCKRTIRNSAELKREYRRVKRQRRLQHSLARLVRPAMSLVVGSMVWALARKTGNATPALALMAVLAFVFASFRARQLLDQLYASPDLPAMVILPISEQQIFRWEFQKVIRRSVWSLIDIMAGFIGLALYLRPSPTEYALLGVLAAVVWIVVIALATFGAAFFPRVPYRLISGGVGTILWFSLVNEWFRGEMMDFVAAHGRTISMVLPTGWAVSLFHLLIPPIDWFYLLLLAPVAVIIGSVKFSIARLRRE